MLNSIKERKRITPVFLFFFLGLLNIGIMLCLLWCSEGKAFINMGYGDSYFCDFWQHIRRLRSEAPIYGSHDADAIFPPLAYLFLSLFSRMMGYVQNLYGVDFTKSGFAVLMFCMYILMFSFAFSETIHYAYHGKKGQKTMLIAILLGSYPFWACAFERGNMVIYAMLFLLIGMVLRDSEEKWKREVALICIAIAATFKLYPAVFGLLYIVEKRCKEGIRLLVYGILLFFVPFLFFGNGIISYFCTFTGYLDKSIYSHTSLIGNCIRLFGDTGNQIGPMVVAIWILWVLFYTLTEKKVTWKTIAMLTSLCTIILRESYLYTYVYLAIPLIFFLNECAERDHTKWKKTEYLYAVLFALVFTIPPFRRNVEGGVLIEMYFCWIAILGMISAEKICSFFVKKDRGSEIVLKNTHME